MLFYVLFSKLGADAFRCSLNLSPKVLADSPMHSSSQSTLLHLYQYMTQLFCLCPCPRVPSIFSPMFYNSWGMFVCRVCCIFSWKFPLCPLSINWFCVVRGVEGCLFWLCHVCKNYLFTLEPRTPTSTGTYVSIIFHIHEKVLLTIPELKEPAKTMRVPKAQHTLVSSASRRHIVGDISCDTLSYAELWRTFLVDLEATWFSLEQKSCCSCRQTFIYFSRLHQVWKGTENTALIWDLTGLLIILRAC